MSDIMKCEHINTMIQKWFEDKNHPDGGYFYENISSAINEIDYFRGICVKCNEMLYYTEEAKQFYKDNIDTPDIRMALGLKPRLDLFLSPWWSSNNEDYHILDVSEILEISFKSDWTAYTSNTLNKLIITITDKIFESFELEHNTRFISLIYRKYPDQQKFRTGFSLSNHIYNNIIQILEDATNTTIEELSYGKFSYVEENK